MNAPEWVQWFADNKRAWDARTPYHLASAMYDVDGWKGGRTSLTPLEVAFAGSVAGRSVLHLQCHFGLDTLSFARAGARVTGVDFSGESIRAARRLAEEAGLAARFVESNVFDLRLDERFDLVFTSWGVIGWLPTLEPWAKTIAEHLSPSGRFILVEFHPYLCMSPTGPDLSLRYSYFNRGPISEQATGTYAAPDAPIECVEHDWNHPMADVVTALLSVGLVVTRLEEHDHIFHDVFPGLEPRPGGGYWFREARGMLPLAYAIEAQHRSQPAGPS